MNGPKPETMAWAGKTTQPLQDWQCLDDSFHMRSHAKTPFAAYSACSMNQVKASQTLPCYCAPVMAEASEQEFERQ